MTKSPSSSKGGQAPRPTSITRAYWIHALTPLHVGAGRGVGFIDLPIMREAVTKWPFVPGSTVKGVLADAHSAHAGSRNEQQKIAFGNGGDEASNAGALVFTDARLICLPVRSLFGTFAWCTSPLALDRWRRDVDPKQHSGLPNPPIPGPDRIFVPLGAGFPSQLGSPVGVDGKAFFEDLDFNVDTKAEATRYARAIGEEVFWGNPAWQTLFVERFAIVHNEVFDFLCETATQVDARVRIDEHTKTVADGQLWYEESLPAETILAGLAWCAPVRSAASSQQALMAKYCEGVSELQIGGKATIGRGQVRLGFTDLLPAAAQP